MSAFEKCSTVRLFKRTDLLLIYYILLVTIFPIAILFIYLFIYVFIFMTSSKLFLVCLYFFLAQLLVGVILGPSGACRT